MKSEDLYLSMCEPDNANHLWRYSPWKKVHPTGKVREIPTNYLHPEMKLSLLDGSEAPDNFSVIKEDSPSKTNNFSDPVSMSFIESVCRDSEFTLRVKNNTVLEQPIILRIDSGLSKSAVNLRIEVGRHCEFELITLIEGEPDWFGLLRKGNIGEGSIINDVVVGQMKRGTLLRVDAINIGKDSQVRAGSISSGSDRTKADLRYMMDKNG